ncbi:RSP_2648 family PIN domain-containing protein [Roseinatronobacter alkalisoli]|uniref:PIN domain-containing protein n=1 Tax=Roseinatronobacter alkalisoli TaxID=3028235 RepID=A0ABT5T841_9RHOB|nr:PIN domain-containing protein [Roseinatronobacter sp. HJB301]MDD7971293.1 PIN domain-containing protein [Roseinatronobacter sp. HJB301]
MRAVLDACVLYPTVLREILVGVAARGGFTPLWSARILAEWQRAAARTGPADAVIAAGEIAHLRSLWPMAEITADPGLEARLDLPDPADKHVLASTITAQADRIITLNLRDFPARLVQTEGVQRAESPDDFLMALWLDKPETVEAAVHAARTATEAASGRAQPLRPLLKRAKLPRLGKALE